MNDDVGGVGEEDCLIEIRGLLQEIGRVSGDEGMAERRKEFKISYGCKSLVFVRRLGLFVSSGKTALDN
jgi:hypothetical protein